MKENEYNDYEKIIIHFLSDNRQKNYNFGYCLVCGLKISKKNHKLCMDCYRIKYKFREKTTFNYRKKKEITDQTDNYYVYVIYNNSYKNPDTNIPIFKIGFSNDIDRRINELEKQKYLADGTYNILSEISVNSKEEQVKLENYLHNYWKENNYNGLKICGNEKFCLNPDEIFDIIFSIFKNKELQSNEGFHINNISFNDIKKTW